MYVSHWLSVNAHSHDVCRHKYPRTVNTPTDALSQRDWSKLAWLHMQPIIWSDQCCTVVNGHARSRRSGNASDWSWTSITQTIAPVTAMWILRLLVSSGLFEPTWFFILCFYLICSLPLACSHRWWWPDMCIWSLLATKYLPSSPNLLTPTTLYTHTYYFPPPSDPIIASSWNILVVIQFVGGHPPQLSRLHRMQDVVSWQFPDQLNSPHYLLNQCK